MTPPLPPPAEIASLSRVVLAMGTRLSLELPAGAAARALEEVERVEALGSTWRGGTAWARLAETPGEWVAQPRESLELLATCLEWQRLTEGAFDPMLAPLVRAWGLRSGGRTPSPAELCCARGLSGSRFLELDLQEGRARILEAGAGIEEGGFLKGYALDRARGAAREFSGLLDFGGQILVWGRPRPVSIAHPRHRQRARCSLRLENASLATTACSERGRHILDPRTGEPVPDWGAVSVVHPSALVADILSTALFVLGPERGLAWSSAQGVAVLFQPHEGPFLLSPAFARLRPVFHER